MKPYSVSFHVAWSLSKINWVAIKTRMGILGGGGELVATTIRPLCAYITCGGTWENHREINCRHTWRHRLLFTVYYLRQSVGSRNADRHIPKDKLTHIHNQQKRSMRHYMYRARNWTRWQIICVHNTSKTEHSQISNYHTRITPPHIY